MESVLGKLVQYLCLVDKEYIRIMEILWTVMHRVTVGEKGEWLYNNEPEFLELFKTYAGDDQ